MKKLIIIILVSLYSMAGFAHNPNISTTVLTEKENNIWVLQISASLTAFQQEIKTHFAATPYKSPEEFKEMVVKHVRNNFEMQFNDEKISLTNGKVLLGHETNVVFEIEGMPSALISIEAENRVFKDIYRSKSVWVILSEKFIKKSFVFSKENDYKLLLTVNENEIIQKSVQEASIVSSEILYLGMFFGLIGLAFLTQYLHKKRKLSLK